MTCLFHFWVWCRRRPGVVFAALASVVAALFMWRTSRLARKCSRLEEEALFTLKDNIDKKSEQDKKQEADDAKRKVDKIHEESSKLREGIIAQLEDNAEKENDPDQVSDLLKKVGDDMRRQ